MPKIADAAKDGYFALYLNDGDFLKLSIQEGKVVKTNDNQLDVFCIAETGISAELQPLRFSIHKGKYKGYNLKERKVTDDNNAYEVEEFIFNQLSDEEFPKDGFKCDLIHAKVLKEYKGRQPASAIEAVECPNLPPIPANAGGNGRSYTSPKDSAMGVLQARVEFYVGSLNEFLAMAGVESELKTLVDIHKLATELKTNSPDVAKQFADYSTFIKSFWAA